MEARVEKLSWIDHTPIMHQGEIKETLQCQTPGQRWNPPTSVALL